MSFDLEEVHNFRRWVGQHQERGIDGLGNDALYVPPDLLLEYWQPACGTDRISRILRALSNTPIHVPVQELAERFIRIFSTLVYTTSIPNPRVSLIIKEFIQLDKDDSLLPFVQEAEPFPHTYGGLNAWKEFEKAQYLFCPVSFAKRMLGKELQERCVLPLTPDGILSGIPDVTGSVVRKYTLHPAGNLETPNVSLVSLEETIR